MTETFITKNYDLDRIPFTPAAAGIEYENNVYIPKDIINKINYIYNTLKSGAGAKAFPISGEYGTGKTVLLKGHLKNFFEEKRIKTFYFENPGSEFYDLANYLMRSLGRYEFSKAMWEISKEYLEKRGQRRLHPISFKQKLLELKNNADTEKLILQLKDVLIFDLKIVVDEEIAYKIASMIVQTGKKPYFDYREFFVRNKNSYVAEKAEHQYFQALIKCIILIYGVEGVAFLIDEFEDVAISKRMTKSKSYDYLATLRHLIDISSKENLWIIMAMTPEASESTKNMNPALWERFTHNDSMKININPLSKEDIKEIVIWWLNKARISEKYSNSLFPFPDNYPEILINNSTDPIVARKLIKLCYFILQIASDNKMISIDEKTVIDTIRNIYPD